MMTWAWSCTQEVNAKTGHGIESGIWETVDFRMIWECLPLALCKNLFLVDLQQRMVL